MDSDFLETLERELKTRDGKSAASTHELSAEVLEAALRRGQEYRAVAMQLALRQMGSVLTRRVRSLIRLLRPQHKPPRVGPDASCTGDT